MRRDERLTKAAHALGSWSMLVSLLGWLVCLSGLVVIAIGFSRFGTPLLVAMGFGCEAQGLFLMAIGSGLNGIGEICNNLDQRR